ncbi:hypothetical protein G4D82_09010 [Flavobacterium sp. CYK-4]|uniref:hypothetical protein n=1 Tax=Flavobacterium lotistagni TaxID=2709660 RepID=UPI0014082AF1|nr:hypothetical protein [Flavobacterium lotistagni]NHM07358.1 hypothetical protein [Flavobacterium lotistagni]
METKTTNYFTRFLYVGFVLFGFYEIIARQSYLSACSSLGIALAFDPFDQLQPWKERPLWQKTWLIVHLGLVGSLFGYVIGVNDKN